ncbi:MAG TPA: TolC family protein [Bryobacteraceae bacterium]|nr:TolC family protein [Bryobacteraceae bacterium]
MPARYLFIFIAAFSALAQVPSFPRPSYFRQTFAHSTTRVELHNPVRLHDFVADGKLELSLRQYLELVMANNTDIQIDLLSVEMPKNAILRAFSTWDPLATASFTDTKSSTPSTGALAGASTVVSLNQPANFSFQQTLPTGLTYSVGFSGAKSTTNSSFQTLNPALNSNLTVSFSQPLLRNRGAAVNRLNLMLARSRFRISEYALRTSLLQAINTAESAYWDAVQARENLHVQEDARKLADESLKLSQKELELGAISPLDIYNPEQQLATAELSVSQAAFALEQTYDALRKQMGADLDPDIRKLPIVLTETVDAPSALDFDPQAEVTKALATRPDVHSALQNLDVDELSIRSAKNEILPNLALTGAYTTQGVGGIYYQRTNVFDTSGNASQIVTAIPGGFPDALSQMFGFGYPVYSFGLNLSLPIRSHAAVADIADALVQKKRDALNARTVQQQVRLSVLNAVSSVNSSKQALKLAITAKDFAQKYLDAENQKYQLGVDPMQFVLQAQTQLSQAESAVVQNQVGLRRNLLNLLTQTGELLDERGIVVR